MYFLQRTGKQSIKQLCEEQLSSNKSASERRQDSFIATIELLKRVGLVGSVPCEPLPLPPNYNQSIKRKHNPSNPRKTIICY